MIEWSRKQTWIAGLTILVLTNVAALGGVAYNRAGEPDGTLVLTERELRLPYSRGFSRENSGISLVIKWRLLPTEFDEHSGRNYRRSAAEWLKEAKLDELGFEVKGAVSTPESRSRLNRSLSRDSWLVLEYDGPAYQAMRERLRIFSETAQELASRNPEKEKFKERAARAGKQWNREQQGASRLFVIDAGLDPAVLRMQYPDPARYIIARGQVRAAVNKTDDGEWEVQGYIKGLAVNAVNVPFAYRSVFEPLLGERSRTHEDPPRYRVTLAYGRRYEPWVVSADKI